MDASNPTNMALSTTAAAPAMADPAATGIPNTGATVLAPAMFQMAPIAEVPQIPHQGTAVSQPASMAPPPAATMPAMPAMADSPAAAAGISHTGTTILPPAMLPSMAPSAEVPQMVMAHPEPPYMASSIVTAAPTMPEGTTVLAPAMLPNMAPMMTDPQGMIAMPPVTEGPLAMPAGGAPTSLQAPSSWAPGTIVMVCGLTSQPAFNGLRGTIQSFDTACGRYSVWLETAPCSQRVAKLKPPHWFSVPQPNQVMGNPHVHMLPNPCKAKLVLDQLVF